MIYEKYILDFRISENVQLHDNYALLKLTPADARPLPEMLPGQFVEVRVDRSPSTFLRRPISINFVDYSRNELWLLIRKAGEGTRTLCGLQAGEILNLVLPLGNTFTLPESPQERVLLVGGGVGIAPMLYWGKYLKEKGYTPRFLLGFRSDKDLLQYDLFRQFGEVYISTEDGSLGEKGFVTQHSILNEPFDRLYVCRAQAHDGGRSPICPRAATLLRSLARKYDGLRRGGLPLLRRRYGRRPCVCMQRRSHL